MLPASLLLVARSQAFGRGCRTLCRAAARGNAAGRGDQLNRLLRAAVGLDQARAATERLGRGLEAFDDSEGRRSAVRPHAAACMLDFEDVAIEIGDPLPTLDRHLKIVDSAPGKRFHFAPEKAGILIREICWR